MLVGVTVAAEDWHFGEGTRRSASTPDFSRPRKWMGRRPRWVENIPPVPTTCLPDVEAGDPGLMAKIGVLLGQSDSLG